MGSSSGSRNWKKCEFRFSIADLLFSSGTQPLERRIVQQFGLLLRAIEKEGKFIQDIAAEDDFIACVIADNVQTRQKDIAHLYSNQI